MQMPPRMQFTSAKSALPACAWRKLEATCELQKAVRRRALIELGFWNICRALWCRALGSLLPFRVTSHVRNRRRHTTHAGLVPSAPGCYAAQHGKHFTYKWKKPFVLLCGRKCAAALAERRDNNLWSERAAFQGYGTCFLHTRAPSIVKLFAH